MENVSTDIKLEVGVENKNSEIEKNLQDSRVQITETTIDSHVSVFENKKICEFIKKEYNNSKDSNTRHKYDVISSKSDDKFMLQQECDKDDVAEMLNSTKNIDDDTEQNEQQSTSIDNFKAVDSIDKSHQCTVCWKSFDNISRLKQHQVVHSGEYKYQCEICNKTFLRLGNLKAHQSTHIGVRRNSCNICNKSFANPSYLKQHLLMHSGVNDHTCEKCGKSFTWASSLRDHQVVHTKERKYRCENCPETFLYLSQLKKHQSTHLQETFLASRKFESKPASDTYSMQ